MKILNFKNLQWLWGSGFLLLLDIGSKYWINTKFYFGEVLFIFPYCNFCYVYNSGLAFGLLSNMHVIFRWLFICIIVLVIIVFVMLLCKSVKYFSKCYYFSYSMIIGGALGNLFDRIVYGAVIDFIDIHIGSWHWPIFNVADIEIFLGIVILMIRHYYLFLQKTI